jgi:hypothetical protein
MGAPSTRPKAQRLLTIATPKHGPAHTHTHTYKQRQKIRNSTTLHKNSTQNYDRTILRVTTIARARKPPKTELRREIYGKNKVQGLFCKKIGEPEGSGQKLGT